MIRPTFLAAAILISVPAATGCASLAPPFDEMDQAQVTVLKLQGQEVAQPATPVAPTTPGIGGLPVPVIPGLTPEQQQQVQQGVDQFLQTLPPGVIPPGLFPGQTTPQAQPQQAQQPRFKGFVILAQTPLTDDKIKDEILDVFGNEENFNGNRGNCFTPGMGIVFQSSERPQPVELLVSLSCNQAMGDGFTWPYQVNGFTPETSQRLARVYEQLWGPVPPGGV